MATKRRRLKNKKKNNKRRTRKVGGVNKFDEAAGWLFGDDLKAAAAEAEKKKKEEEGIELQDIGAIKSYSTRNAVLLPQIYSKGVSLSDRLNEADAAAQDDANELNRFLDEASKSENEETGNGIANNEELVEKEKPNKAPTSVDIAKIAREVSLAARRAADALRDSDVSEEEKKEEEEEEEEEADVSESEKEEEADVSESEKEEEAEEDESEPTEEKLYEMVKDAETQQSNAVDNAYVLMLGLAASNVADAIREVATILKTNEVEGAVAPIPSVVTPTVLPTSVQDTGDLSLVLRKPDADPLQSVPTPLQSVPTPPLAPGPPLQSGPTQQPSVPTPQPPGPPPPQSVPTPLQSGAPSPPDAAPLQSGPTQQPSVPTPQPPGPPPPQSGAALDPKDKIEQIKKIVNPAIDNLLSKLSPVSIELRKQVTDYKKYTDLLLKHYPVSTSGGGSPAKPTMAELAKNVMDNGFIIGIERPIDDETYKAYEYSNYKIFADELEKSTEPEAKTVLADFKDNELKYKEALKNNGLKTNEKMRLIIDNLDRLENDTNGGSTIIRNYAIHTTKGKVSDIIERYKDVKFLKERRIELQKEIIRILKTDKPLSNPDYVIYLTLKRLFEWLKQKYVLYHYKLEGEPLFISFGENFPKDTFPKRFEKLNNTPASIDVLIDKKIMTYDVSTDNGLIDNLKCYKKGKTKCN